MIVGKLEWFANLNGSAIKGDNGEGEQWGRDEIYPDGYNMDIRWINYW